MGLHQPRDRASTAKVVVDGGGDGRWVWKRGGEEVVVDVLLVKCDDGDGKWVPSSVVLYFRRSKALRDGLGLAWTGLDWIGLERSVGGVLTPGELGWQAGQEESRPCSALPQAPEVPSSLCTAATHQTKAAESLNRSSRWVTR